MIRRSLGRLLFLLAGLATALLALAMVVRWTVQDRWSRLALLFYTTPWLVMAVGAGICAVYWHGSRHRFIAALLTVECLVALTCWLQRDWQWRPATEARGALRVVHWNVDRPDRRQPGTMAWIAAQDADLIAIAERQPKKKNTLKLWQAAFPGYQLMPLRGETLCLVRGEILSTKKEMRMDGSFATAIRTSIEGHALTVLQVDIVGNPLTSRAEALGKLAGIVDRLSEENLIVLGDFNTPVDSALVTPWRGKMTNAFEAAGSGYIATWPMPLPVLSLDQVWTSGRLRAVRCEHIGSWRSDHRAVVTEIDFVR